ncbi:similar to Saccharomyces cerevisiae YEL065W SIT1 Ferrioxamine B transporter, member of the ARN family of transporters that specifically recognize siderophore-iron chelates [Maudiozyma saulgeensis]|uniref:Similar to Saccharomyces cerevisiae YEL065W SIT1 Ferrioxamine B transporter, member of the ARN family of transporters that specifically recognize siderophore-iron chelates n=1 Tax=Maudiozyma saulgeensis TaxID=1789683 RepID=A0A1X7R8D2_9SACH|nr:similar to Saccharomyces cerevisiae YEL065W SIT1 Ferrioxamine B transporter, member of the ARN family of transporters that specifically recognize siderophore-iron chelates [Kazachstania saulgeensis]
MEAKGNSEIVSAQSNDQSPISNEKIESKGSVSTYSNSIHSGFDSSENETPALEKAGVHNAEIYCKYYSHPFKRVLIFFSLFLIAFAYGLDNSVRSTYQTLATSSYSQHSLLSTVTCIKKVVSAAAQIWFARSADMFGRTTILLISIVLYVVGTIIESQAYDVSRYAAGAIIFAIGHSGIVMVSELYVADFSNLNWRVTAAAAQVLPNVITTWISGNITGSIDERWSWGIGMWAFIFPLSCIPLLICIMHMKYLAKKNNEDIWIAFRKPKNMSWSEFCIDIFFWKLDIVGLVLLVAIFGMILIPFTLAGGVNEKWKSASIIVPEVLGWVLAIPLYAIWELKFSRYPITPWNVVKDRGIWAPLVISLFQEFAYYMQSTYMITVLYVAVNQTKAATARINKLFSFVGVLTAFIFGFVVAKIRRTKEIIVFGIGVWFIGFGLLEKYTGGLEARVGIIAAICVLGFGNGFIKFPVRASIQASAYTHEMMGVATSLFLSVASIGSAFGSAVAGSIWSNILPGEINKRITTNSTLAAYAYSSPTKFIKQYTWETTERQGVVQAYKYVEKILNIVALCLLVPMLIASIFLRNRRLEDAISFDKYDKEQQKLEK